MKEEAKGTILIVDDVPDNIKVLFEYLSQQGYKILVADDGEGALEQIQYIKPDLILLDIMMPGMDGYETCRQIKSSAQTSDIPVIFITALSETVNKIAGFEIGAVDYITKPFQQEEVLARVTTHLTLQRLRRELEQTNQILEDRVKERTIDLTASNIQLKKEILVRQEAESKLLSTLKEVEELKNQLFEEKVYLQEEIKTSSNFDNIITQSDSLKKVLSKIEQVAKTDSTVLVLGETGTGKELIARAIHDLSNRRDRFLVKVNCAALPANLIESELFGHEKGAFTGALTKKIGRFELADKGTIFLDEIGDLPLELQSKLLRVLQEGEFERLGNPMTIKTDVRIIAATNRNLKQSVGAGEFREDLYYRLNVFPVMVPPLRDREDDIALLVRHFVKKYSVKIGKKITNVPQKLMNALENYHWPGNVRELENIIERAVIISDGDSLQMDDFSLLKPETDSEEIIPKNSLQDIEKKHIIEVLKQCNWIIDGKRGAAKKLGLPASTLRDRMKKHNIYRP